MSAIVKPPTREQQAQRIVWLEAEVERLKAALIEEGNEKYLITKASLDRQAQIERLKAALQRIAEQDDDEFPHHIARAALDAALEGK